MDNHFILTPDDCTGGVKIAPTDGCILTLLDSAPDDFTKSANAKLRKSENISLSGHPGKEFEFAIGDRVNGKGRVYMVGRRPYLVVVGT